MKKLFGSETAGSFVFNPSAKTITFSGITLSSNQFLLITNTTKNTIIYNFADVATGGSFSSNVLTLTYNTTTMSSSDALQIFIEVPDTVEGSMFSVVSLLEAILDKLPALKTSINGELLAQTGYAQTSYASNYVLASTSLGASQLMLYENTVQTQQAWAQQAQQIYYV